MPRLSIEARTKSTVANEAGCVRGPIRLPAGLLRSIEKTPRRRWTSGQTKGPRSTSGGQTSHTTKLRKTQSCVLLHRGEGHPRPRWTTVVSKSSLNRVDASNQTCGFALPRENRRGGCLHYPANCG